MPPFTSFTLIWQSLVKHLQLGQYAVSARSAPPSSKISSENITTFLPSSGVNSNGTNFFFSIFCFLRCFSLEFNSTWNHYGSTKQLKIFNSSTAACSIDSCTEKLELLFCFSTGMENMVLSTDTGPTPGKFFLSFMSMTPTWHHQSPGLNCWLLRAHTASEEHLTMPFSWPW